MDCSKSSDAGNPVNRKWTYFEEPVPVDTFDYQTLQEVIIEFGKAIPQSIPAKKAKLLLFLRTGGENGGDFWTRTKPKDQFDEIVHWTYGCRYPQSAISYNSETIEIPCYNTREFRVKANKLQKPNCHKMQYFITGYLL